MRNRVFSQNHRENISKGKKGRPNVKNRNEYIVISPLKEVTAISGRANLKTFCVENNLAMNTLITNVDKGVIVVDIQCKTGKFANAWNAQGWEIKKIN
jgi:hypothetical protein